MLPHCIVFGDALLVFLIFCWGLPTILRGNNEFLCIYKEFSVFVV